MIFAQQLQKIDPTNGPDAIRKMASHIKYLQEQLEYTLLNLDSRNINEIDIEKTTIIDNTGTTNLGSYIHLTGTNGESFTAGKNASGKFEFSVRGKDGKQTIWLDRSGKLNITEIANLTIDGGEW